MRILKTILFLLIIAGCNPAKQVMKHQAQFEEIGTAWSKIHPCLNDSTTITLPGTIDSVPIPVPVADTNLLKSARDSIAVALAKKYNRNTSECDRQVKEAFNVGYSMANDEWKKKKIAIKQPDTIKTTNRDVRKENLLIAENERSKVQISEIKDQSQKFKDQRNYAYMGIGILVLVAVIYAFIKSKL